MIKTILMLLVAGQAHASTLQSLDLYTSSATSRITGIMGVAASTSSYKTLNVFLNGPGGYIQFPDSTKQYSAAVSSSTFASWLDPINAALSTAAYTPANNAFSGYNSYSGSSTFNGSVSISSNVTVSQPINANGAPAFKFSTYSGLQRATSGALNGLQLYDQSTYDATVFYKLGGYGPSLYGKGALIGSSYLGINNSNPIYTLDVTGGGHFTSSMTVDGGVSGLGYIAYGSPTSWPSGVGNYAAMYYSTPYGAARFLGFDGSNYLKTSLGALYNGDFGINISTSGTVDQTTTTIRGSLTANTYYGDGSHLTGITSGVSKIVAGTNITLDPSGGTGEVTINATGGGVVDSTAVIDGLPIGSIIEYSTTTPPTGYLYCNGGWYSTTTYSALFDVVGYRYSTYTVIGAQFQVPDFRGMFARGLDDGAGRDTELYRVIGDTETDTMQGHYHYSAYLANGGGGANNNYGVNGTVNTAYPGTGGVSTDSAYGAVRVSAETRPENIAVAYMIKYAHVGTVAISSTSLINAQENTWTYPQTFSSTVTVNGPILSTQTVRAWARFDGSGNIQSSYNVTSVTRNSTGIFTIVWGTAFSGNQTYVCLATADRAATNYGRIATTDTQSTTGVKVYFTDSAGTLENPNYGNVIAVGF